MHLLIRNGVNPNQVINHDEQSWAPLFRAILQGTRDGVEILLNAGADINYKINFSGNHIRVNGIYQLFEETLTP